MRRTGANNEGSLLRALPLCYSSLDSLAQLCLTFRRCQRCHSHKIKCSGDLPCSKCRAVGVADECVYAPRDRQVKVSEKYEPEECKLYRYTLNKNLSTIHSYLDQILAENRRLKEQSVTSTDAVEANDAQHAEK